MQIFELQVIRQHRQSSCMCQALIVWTTCRLSHLYCQAGLGIDTQKNRLEYCNRRRIVVVFAVRTFVGLRFESEVQFEVSLQTPTFRCSGSFVKSTADVHTPNNTFIFAVKDPAISTYLNSVVALQSVVQYPGPEQILGDIGLTKTQEFW